MNSEFVVYLILSLLGFFIGGAIGAIWFEGFSPACWIGLAVVWGAPFCACACD